MCNDPLNWYYRSTLQMNWRVLTFQGSLKLTSVFGCELKCRSGSESKALSSVSLLPIAPWFFSVEGNINLKKLSFRRICFKMIV